jgi:type IX secretion system PorP/SprF family membrane protein
MVRYSLLLIFVLTCCLVVGQQREIPPDFRSHNLSQFNSSLIDPTFSYNRNMPRSISVWSRWQWQTIDSDPTTLFINYTQKLTRQTAIGIGFLQNNTGIYLNRGANLNFSYAFQLGEESNLVLGTNIFAFTQELADEQLSMNPINGGGLSNIENSFIAQFSPGIRINANSFSMGMVVENALEQNFSNSDMESAPRVFTGFVSNDFPIFLFDEVSYFRPQAYIRAIPDLDTQYGLTALFTNPKFWVQGGYNNFYGVSGGAGITLFEKLSLGGLVEFGLEEPASNEDPTFEIVASYFFGEQKFAEKEEKEKKSVDERMKEAEERRRLAEEQRESARLEQERQLAQARQDSINKAREAAIAAELEKARQDSIARVEREKEVVVQPDEKYEEVVTADGLKPGFYLIANVFGTERYFLNFMKTLRTQGLEPKSFLRSLNGYNYVYLERYDTIEEARAARDSQYNGRYTEALWIFRVRGQ